MTAGARVARRRRYCNGRKAGAITAPLQDCAQDCRSVHLAQHDIGGVIGAGLFVGSGAGYPCDRSGGILTYALCGALIVLLMRMLGEMARQSVDWAFADYAAKPWAGFSIVLVLRVIVGFEAVAGGKVLTYWIDAPLWLASLCLMMMMTATVSVSSFGEDSSSGSPESRLPPS